MIRFSTTISKKVCVTGKSAYFVKKTVKKYHRNRFLRKSINGSGSVLKFL